VRCEAAALAAALAAVAAAEAAPPPPPQWLLRAGDHIVGIDALALGGAAGGAAAALERALRECGATAALFRARRLTDDGRLVQESFSPVGRAAGGALARPGCLGPDAALEAPLRAALVALLKAEKMALNAKFVRFSRPWAERLAGRLDDELRAALADGSVAAFAERAMQEAFRIRHAISMTPKGKRIPGEERRRARARAVDGR